MAIRFLAVLALFAGAPEAARPDPPARPAAAAETGAKKVLRPGEVEVKGRVRKATVPPLTPPTVTVGPPAEPRESFVRKIVEAVDKEPFP